MWRQTPLAIVNSVTIPLIGIAGTAIAWLSSNGEMRERWGALCFLTVSAAIAALLVQRSSGIAALIAIPGAVRLIHPALVRARTIANIWLRVLRR